MRNRDLLAQILAGGENARVTMKELCALVQNFCSAGMCTEDQWKGVQDAMKIPYPKPADVPWREWIREWCSLFGNPLSSLSQLITESMYGPADLLRMQWIYDYCNPMADADEYQAAFIRMMYTALYADSHWISYIRYDQISLPLIRMLERYSPPGPAVMNKWAVFFQSLAVIAEKFNREQCTEICNFIMESPTFANLFVNLNSWHTVHSRITALSRLAQCSARYFQTEVFEFVLNIHRSVVFADTNLPLGVLDSRSIWGGTVLAAAGYGNLDAFKWLWENLQDNESFGLQRNFEQTVTRAKKSGNADLVEFILKEVWRGNPERLKNALHDARTRTMEYPAVVLARLEQMAHSYGIVGSFTED